MTDLVQRPRTGIDEPIHSQGDVPVASDVAIPKPPKVRGNLAFLVLVGLAILLVVVSAFSATIGQFPVTFTELWESLQRGLSGNLVRWEAGEVLTDGEIRMAQVDGSLWQIRFPRIALGLIVGACLGLAGCLTQGLFGNPLAEPSIIGTSAGAAVGACLVIVTGWGMSTFGLWAQPVGAFIGAIVTTGLVYAMARLRGVTQVLTIVLTGIAVNAVANALIALLIFLADQTSRDAIVFWQLGSLNGAMWRAVIATAPLLLIGVVVALILAPSLDLVALGERSARHLGVNVEQLRIVAVIVLAMLTAAAVSFAGLIAFVGLIVPHLFRIVLGPSHKVLVPASALGGALLIAGADIGARTLVAFADLPIGMFTALIGGPVFYFLLRRFLRREARG